MIKRKSVEDILLSPYVRQKDIERALDIETRQAARVFRAAKQDEHDRGLVEVSPRKVRRESVEKVTGISFSRIAKEKAATCAANGVGDSGQSIAHE